MNALAATEADFQGFVLGADSAIVEQIVGDEDFRRRRLGIYFDAYRLRLAEVLGHDFDVLRQYVGDEVFETMARDYIAAHPSEFRNVRWFGHRFAGFLRNDPRFAATPALCELAELEWALGLAFDAPDKPVARFTELTTLPPDVWAHISFVAHPSLHLLSFRSNAPTIWKAIQDDGPPVAPASLDQPICWAVWRRDQATHFRSLASDEAWAAEAMRKGRTFSEICDGMCAQVGEENAAASVASHLRTWVEDGWISAATGNPAAAEA
jgi:hypothetical protein